MLYTIDYIQRTPKTSKVGKPYTALSLKVIELPEVWLNGFEGFESKGWTKGDKVELEIVKNVVNGKEFTNFKVPTKTDALEKRVADLEAWQKQVKDFLASKFK